ncbi:hypothetical protein NQ317_012530 [Molorchus minor]|uniref:Peptidase S1 domain-containing protein n=1 Tax=Molorchus minor TaxID=1323400 RepID=A0ABQ9K2S4_9CUCU|nr:hypothetical protein NQ317_012530 [Molorchus minor]
MLCIGIWILTTILAEQTNEKLNVKCICVPYYQCTNDFSDLNTNGIGLINFREMDNTCDGYFDVCCNATKGALFPLPEAPEKLFGCGYQNIGFFSWYSSLFFQETETMSPSHTCGISLIHPKAVLTAAHCINRHGIWSVRFGSAFRKISKIIIHPKFNNAKLHNDIALAILDKPIKLSEKINTVCIPPPGTVLDNTLCKVMVTVRNTERDISYLRMMKVPIVPRNSCLERLRNTRLGLYFQLHSSFLCAGGEKNGNTCVGDGGSPLVCQVPGQPERYHQIVGGNNAPDVYAKLPIFREWIDEEMMNNGLEITTYRY